MNERETEKYRLISGLETTMRNKAEVEAMKAAARSQWSYHDPEMKELANRVSQMESRMYY